MRAAFKQFADKGYKGASIADIAKSAHVRKSLIQYHFGTKEQLWNACLSNRVEPIVTAIDHMLESGDHNFPQIVLMRFRMIRDNPDVRRLIAWASLSGIPAPQFLIDRRERILARMSAAKGSPGDPDGGGPEKLAYMLFALAASDGWLHFRSLYSLIAGDEVLEPEVEHKFLEILSEVASKIE